MWSRLLISFSLILTICSQAAALPSGRNESLLDRRADVLPQTVFKPWPKDNTTSLHPLQYCWKPSGDRLQHTMEWWFHQALGSWSHSQYVRYENWRETDHGKFFFPIQFIRLRTCPTEGGDFLTVRISKGDEVFTTPGYNGQEHSMDIGRGFLKIHERTEIYGIRRLKLEIGRSMGLPGPFQVYPDAFVLKCEQL